jgi:large subunit ribosomal protein L6e
LVEGCIPCCFIASVPFVLPFPIMAKGGKTRGPRVTRNPELVPGVRRYGSIAASSRRAQYKHSKKGLGKNQPHKAPQTADKLEGRFYAADDTAVPLRSHRGSAKPTKLRKSIQPGTVVIVLAGRFRGKRVIVLKQLKSGLLLVTGPYKVNGVPLRRLNQAYVIATSTKVDVSKVDVSKIDDAFFARKATKKAAGKEGEEFFSAEKKKSPVDAAKKAETARVSTALLAVIKATPELRKYLNAKFSLTRGQKPHLLKF